VRIPLPIDQFLPELLSTLRKQPSLVLSAAPGAGKTTRLPPRLLEITDKAVWVLEPRRIAAISASQRIAEENGWELGREVGYQVRFENRSSRTTRLLFLTEALLLRKLLQDPELKDVGCVVLDEFHERSLHVDLALGALKELQELARPDLKIVVMSATLNAAPLAAYLGGAPAMDVPGKLHPLKVVYEEKSQLLRTGPDFTERMRRLIQRAFSESSEGDLLCFLPGRGEIEWLRQDLADWAELKSVALLPLHGQLNLQEQKAALESRPGRRRVILATNVAESSLTVEGVRIVVDSGLARIAQLHPRTGFESLDLARISKASATQRAGRAARLGPGTVYRAWIPYDELSMKEFEPPEISRTDLAESLLLLAALGVTKAESFSWFEAPPGRSLEQARAFLRALGAIDGEGALTATGRALREYPVHPRIAKLLLAGRERGLTHFACDLAALLSEGGGKGAPGARDGENDLWLRWQEWKRSTHHPRGRQLDRVAAQLRTLAGEREEAPPSSQLEKAMPELLLEIYGDRLCRRRRPHEPQAKMAGGRGVKLHPDSSVRSSEYFLAVELSEGRDVAETLVFQAVGVPDELVARKILPLASPANQVEWDGEKNRFFVNETEEWNGLPVGRWHRRPATASEVEGQLAELAHARWAQILAANSELSSWLARLRFLHKASGEKWPPLSPEQEREALEQACYGETSFEALTQKELVPYFENLLPEAQRNALASECPSHWVVPSGSRIRIVYSEEQGPQVEVRLQELFGLASQPRIAGQPLTLILLGPNFRPVQVTRDLASFWRSGYIEVRKELRARYPKHSWPEDPLTAPPQAKGRPRNT
jgi:ATP-dependent helicase HrpB